jgi:endonuclease YncB( thermonuclease family)
VRDAWGDELSLRDSFAHHPVWQRLAFLKSFTSISKRTLALVAVGTGAIILVLMAWYFQHTPQVSSSASRANTVGMSTSAQHAPSASPVSFTAEPDYMTDFTDLAPVYKNYKVEIANDGSLQAGKQAFQLYGIKILPRSRICTYRNGERWACGQRAYIALLNVLGSTTVDCRPKDADRPHVVVCRLAGVDISELMLHEGWGTLADGVGDKRYVNAATSAYTNKTGMWRLFPASRATN